MLGIDWDLVERAVEGVVQSEYVLDAGNCEYSGVGVFCKVLEGLEGLISVVFDGSLCGYVTVQHGNCLSIRDTVQLQDVVNGP